jgi:DNA (cytosine-5)-methyltransferase 1
MIRQLSIPLIAGLAALAGELVGDGFAGGGGASLGIEEAVGRTVDVAINHDDHAIHIHRLNHPLTRHYCEKIEDVDPIVVCAGLRVGMWWFSPDCTHHSRAKGGKPRDQKIRGLAWQAVRWAAAVSPRVIFLENVPEFVDWCPLIQKRDKRGRLVFQKDGTPWLIADPARKGVTFREFIGQLQALGYTVEWRTLCAADFGAPTTRKRLFLVARRDGLPIAWPEPSHGPGRAHPYRTAAECIDWSIPCPSIFGRKKPLAEKTLRRIAHGVVRYVIENARPFIVPVKSWGGGGNGPRSIDLPMRTVTASKRGEFAVVAPTLVQTGYGEREGQRPRSLDLQKPLGTIVGCGQKHALVAAFIAKHYTGVIGQEVERPLGTITAKDHHSAVVMSLTKFQQNNRGCAIDEPLDTVMAGAQRFGLVAAFIQRYYSNGGQLSGADQPVPTITTKDRMALVTVEIDGETWAIVDIGMRMLQPRELARAQGFPDSYQFTGTKQQQVARIGNSVCPPVARALVAANFGASRPYPKRRKAVA